PSSVSSRSTPTTCSIATAPTAESGASWAGPTRRPARRHRRHNRGSMSETPPSGLPKSVEPPTPQAPAGNTGALRVVAILVMIGSILGLLGSGLCFLAFATDGGFYGDM